MRITCIIISLLLLGQICLANTFNDSLLQKMDSVFISLIQDNQAKSKFCAIDFQSVSADIDFLPSKYILTNISRDYLLTLLGRTSQFFPDSSKAIQTLQVTFGLSSGNAFDIEFHYKEKNNKIVWISYLILFPKGYLLISNGYK